MQHDREPLYPVPLSITPMAVVNITIETSPPDLEVVVDGVPALSPQTYLWENGTDHLIAVSSPQTIGDTRYIFIGWSDGGPAEHVVRAEGPTTVSASFATEYRVNLSTSPPGARLTVDSVNYSSPVEFWWAAGSAHDLVLDEVQFPSEDVGLGDFLWNDGGPARRTIVADGPMALAGVFTKTSFLLMLEAPASADARCSYDSCWYLAGDTATFSFAPPADNTSGTRLRYLGWTTETGNASLDSAPTGSLRMDGPKRVSSAWVTEHHLSIQSDRGVPTGAGWHASGGLATVEITDTEVVEGAIRWVFAGWSGGVNTTEPKFTVEMDGPLQLSAAWRRQYLLAVESAPGAASGAGWYDEGALATVTLPGVEVDSAGRRWRFAGWGGDAGGLGLEATVRMDAPRTVTARWEPVAAGVDPLAAAAVAAALVAAAVVVLRTPRGEYVVAGLSVPLFTRLRRDEVRNQFTRGRLLQYIEDHPGAGYVHLRRRLGLSNGACAYHLRVLERNGEIRRVVSGASVRFYGADYKFDAEALPPLAYVQRRILEEVVRTGSASFAQLSEALAARGEAVTATNLGYHLNVLAREKQLVETRREGRKTIYYVEDTRRKFLRERLQAEYAVDEGMDAAALSRTEVSGRRDAATDAPSGRDVIVDLNPRERPGGGGEGGGEGSAP